jgi:hypothetical protein
MSWVLIMVALMVTVYHCFLRFMVGGFLVFIGSLVFCCGCCVLVFTGLQSPVGLTVQFHLCKL